MEYVSFVILHYKDYSVTDTCVRSILAMEQQERIRIVIVDNDIQKKEKDRQELLQKYQGNSRIKVLQIKENGGFSYANNQGYQYAREHFGKSYIIVLNNDIEFTQKDFISRLEKSYVNNQCYVLGPDVIRQSTGEHQNPMDTRLRTKEEAEYTIKMNRLALRFYPVMYPVVYHMLQKAEKNKIENQKQHMTLYSQLQKNIVPLAPVLFLLHHLSKKKKKPLSRKPGFSTKNIYWRCAVSEKAIILCMILPCR